MNDPRTPELQSLLEVDRLVHEPARLAILTVLSAAEEVRFTHLEAVLGLTRGNLSSHVSRLEEAGYLTVTKAFRERRPLTRYQLTARGRKALENYRRQMLLSLTRPKGAGRGGGAGHGEQKPGGAHPASRRVEGRGPPMVRPLCNDPTA